MCGSTQRYYRGDDAQVPWETYGQPWWELTSDLTLPFVSPSMMLADRHGRRITDGDFSKGCYRHEDLYGHAELHYRAEDIEPLVGTFDLAHTREAFGQVQDPSVRPLVASKRLYELCRSKGLQSGWAPVRIDTQ
jgi:hypothetical protein